MEQDYIFGIIIKNTKNKKYNKNMQKKVQNKTKNGKFINHKNKN